MLEDHKRAHAHPLKAVHVVSDDSGDEYYEVGKRDVTDVRWGETSGHMFFLKTIIVYRNGKPHSEHIFSNVVGVYYKE